MKTESEDTFLAQFEKFGFAVIDHFTENAITIKLANSLEVIRKDEQFKKAGIGKEGNFQISDEQRGDYIHWIDQAIQVGPVAAVLLNFEDLRIMLNRHFYFGIQNFECHYTQYPIGSHYKKHVDRHHSGSPRIVSFVLYLNDNWKPEDGGVLRIHSADGSVTDIIPQYGSMVVFLSEMEHEVLTTHRLRNSITGWMRQSE